jgi:D-alanine-D-alanine ligase-like ATP-grasp enzyme
VLIEEKIDVAYEAECAYFSVKGKEIITTPGGISCDGGFYDYEKKYITCEGVKVSESVPISEDLSRMAVEYSRRLAHTLGLRHLSRIDFFVTRSGRLIFNEINTMPGFTSTSLYPRLLRKAGLEPSDAVNMMIRDTLEED